MSFISPSPPSHHPLHTRSILSRHCIASIEFVQSTICCNDYYTPFPHIHIHILARSNGHFALTARTVDLDLDLVFGGFGFGFGWAGLGYQWFAYPCACFSVSFFVVCAA